MGVMLVGRQALLDKALSLIPRTYETTSGVQPVVCSLHVAPNNIGAIALYVAFHPLFYFSRSTPGCLEVSQPHIEKAPESLTKHTLLIRFGQT
jgi:hypothetical protein